jgi:predicted AAA+ superfamily ATPase
MQMKRYFNTSGPNILKKHYTLMRESLVERGENLVKDDRYFTIWAPRQSGKSTYFRLLATELEKEGHKVCSCKC